MDLQDFKSLKLQLIQLIQLLFSVGYAHRMVAVLVKNSEPALTSGSFREKYCVCIHKTC